VRRVLSVDADRQSPLSLAVLVDMSGSMRVGPKIGMARHVFDAVLAQLRTGVDEVALFTFDATLHERQGFTTDLAQLRTGLDDFAPFGATSLFDATAATARRLADRSAARKAILVLTDGIDTSSMMSASEVSGLAASIDAPVYVVATVAPLDQRAMIEAGDRAGRTDTTDLRDLADWTGGQLAFAASFVESSAVAARLVDELRLQYILSIEASPEREWRRLDVRVNRPSAIVKARSGYFGG
jgi:VWFA-related protein